MINARKPLLVYFGFAFLFLFFSMVSSKVGVELLVLNSIGARGQKSQNLVAHCYLLGVESFFF